MPQHPVEDFFCKNPISFEEMFSRNTLDAALMGDVQALACIVKGLAMRAAFSRGAAPPAPLPPTLKAVVGGSGALYDTIALAIVGEAPFAASDGPYVPQAGTVAGVIVGQGAMSAVDNFYKDWYVINQSGASSANGMAQQFARVSDYVGATRTLTIDKPLNFTGATGFLLVKPAYISLLKDRVEDVTFSGLPRGIVLELTGHRLEGKIDVADANFVHVIGGAVSNGIDWTSTGGVLWIEKCSISRRDATIYAVLVRPFTLFGRVVLKDCTFFGRVAGRMPQCGWEIQNCRNWGSADTANDVPYALVEALAGSTLTVTQVDVTIDSEFSGAFFYAEGALAIIAGATAYLSAQGAIRSNRDFFGTTVASRRFTVARAVVAGVVALTVTAGAFNVDLSSVNAEPDIFQTPSGMDIPNYGPTASLLALENATGASTLTISYPSSRSVLISTSNNSHFSIVSIEGSGTTSGSATVAGTSGVFVSARSRADVACVATVMGALTGSVTVSVTFGVSQGSVAFIFLLASQTAGAPTITFSGVAALDQLVSLRLYQVATGVSVSVGTYLVSGSFITASLVAIALALPSTVSGGTWTISAQLFIEFLDSSGNITFTYSGTGGTVTISGLQMYVGGRINALRLASCIGAGGTIVNSGAITFLNMSISQTAGILARATTATSTARCTGAVLFVGCTFESAMTMLTATLAGGIAEGPSSLRFENCDFRSTWNDRGAADLGTFTWATATLQWKNSHIEGLVTILGTSFTTIEAIETRFSGNASEKSITLTGTRPTTLRYWDCGFAARFDDLLPEKIDVYDVLPAAAALVQGQPVTINATQQAVVCVAGSFLEGASMDAPAGAGSRTVIVREGRLFLAVNGAVASGDALTIDLVTPTQFATGAVPGQTGGRALEAAGATVAGKAYSSVFAR